MSTASTTSAPAACWACGATLGSSALLCPSCGKVQPLGNIDYYQVFGLDRKLGVDTPALEREFHRLSRKLHPDRFARATAQEQEWSLAATALLNDAYRILRDPIQRTEYLLKLSGLKIGEENSGKSKSADRQPPADLLEEVFELNMQLEEMRRSKKMGEDEPELRRELMTAKDAFDEKMVQAQEDLEALWRRWDAALEAHDEPAKLAARDAMVALLNKRSYLRNLVRDVNEVLSTATA